MFLTAYIDSVGKIFTDNNFQWGELGINTYLKWESVVSTGYQNITNPVNLDKYTSNYNYLEVRNEMISLLSEWNGLDDNNKKAMVRNFVYPQGTSQADLDLLYTQNERNNYKEAIMEKTNGDPKNMFSIWKDKTNGKYYKVYSDGDVTVKTEITTYEQL